MPGKRPSGAAHPFLMPNLPILAILLLPFLAQAATRRTSLGLATVSTGTWATYGTLDGFVPARYTGGLERYEFNNLAVLGLYGTVLGQPAFFSLPWKWTAIRRSDGTRNRIAAGDAEAYVGQRFGRTEVRAGLIFPAGYGTGKGMPWIGPGNLQATLGLAVNPNITRYSRRWEFPAEVKAAYALDDGLAKAGSWGVYPSAKVSFRYSQRWKFGLETQAWWKSSYWGRSASFGESVLGRAGPAADRNAGVVPDLYAEAYLSDRVALGAKAGHSLWGYRDAASYNASLYLLWFP